MVLKKLSTFLTVLGFVFLSVFLVYAESTDTTEDTSTVSWDTLGSYFSTNDDLESVDTSLPILFVSDDCEACETLKEGLDGITLIESVPQIVNISSLDDFNGENELIAVCKYTETLTVPTLVYDGECISGKLNVQNKINSLAIQESSEIEDETTEILTNTISIQEFLSKSLLENVTGSMSVWEYVAIGVFVLAFIVFLIFFVIRGKVFSNRGRVIGIVLQISLLALPLGYLGYKVNNIQQLSSTYTSAAEGYATWAEKIEALAKDPSTAQGREAVRIINRVNDQQGWENFKAEQQNTLKTQSKYAMEVTKKSDGTYDLDKANSLVDKLQSGDYDINNDDSISVRLSSGIESQSYNITSTLAATVSPTKYFSKVIEHTYKKDSMEDSRENIWKEAFKSAQLSFTTESGTLTGCTSVSECSTILLYYNDAMKAYYTENQDNTSINFNKYYYYQYDSRTGVLVETPVSLNVIDACNPTAGGGTEWDDAWGTCLCDNGKGTSIGTPTIGGQSCSAVCSVRDLLCEDCNPEPPDIPVNPSDDPYCGDGILGNVSGEECEKNNPSGVQCSWNVCSGSCKCPEATNYCGDGVINGDEQCELGNPSGSTCTWDTCNQVNCKCVEPGCGDGKIDEGETCERGDPEGFQCLWDTECNQLSCDCKVEPSEECGDGTLNDDEQCEVGSPSGSLCSWEKCSKSTCKCPSTNNNPSTGIFDTAQDRIYFGFGLLVLGIFVYMFGGNILYFVNGIGKRIVFIKDGQRIENRVKWESRILRKIKK